MGNWFGSIGLAYKFAIVFGALLVLTILAGLLKLWYNHHRLKKHTKAEELEAGQKEDQLELNQREKDEGDLFGIRAIEAGFFAGIPQSRPTSRAGSPTGSPNMSSSTLVGGVLNSPKLHTHSVASSITTLPAAYTGNRDSETLPSNSPPRRKSPPAIRLAPSEAELSGRMNHGGTNPITAVNMNISVPPSPVLSREPSPTFGGGSDSGDDDSQASPRSLSPNTSTFPQRPEYYAPVPPQIPMPQGLRPSYHAPESTAKSQAASFNDPSPGQSPRSTPESRSPSMPARAIRDEPRSQFPVYLELRPTLPKIEVRDLMAKESNPEPEPESPTRPFPKLHSPTHHRDMSDASSVYSKANTHQHNRSNSADFAYNYSHPEHSRRNSTALGESIDQTASNSHLAPGSTTSSQTGQTGDPRLSDFYDAYYRHSHLGLGIKSDGPKRQNQLNLKESTIVEVPSPQPSPNPSAQAGVAM